MIEKPTCPLAERRSHLHPLAASRVLDSHLKGSEVPKTTKPTAGGGAVGFVGLGGSSGRRRDRPFRQGREEVALSKIPDPKITQLAWFNTANIA
jgi:hypothetical protein